MLSPKASTSGRRRSLSSSSSTFSGSMGSPREHDNSPMRHLGPWYPGTILGEACLMGIAIGGDLISTPAGSSGLLKYLPQLVDNLTHALIAALVWGTAIVSDVRDSSSTMRPRQATNEVLGALLAGSLVDLDHFIAAGSAKMKDALSLHSRPLGHCVSIVMLESLAAWLISESVPLTRGRGCRYGLLVLSSGISHQLRDSTRRGLWFCPLASTPKIPYPVYLAILAGLPILVRCLLMLSCSSRLSSASYSAVPVVDQQQSRIEIV